MVYGNNPHLNCGKFPYVIRIPFKKMLHDSPPHITGGQMSSPFGCFRKWWYPQIIHFNKVFHYKPSILGYPYFLKTPICKNGTFFSTKKLRRKQNHHLPRLRVVSLAQRLVEKGILGFFFLVDSRPQVFFANVFCDQKKWHPRMLSNLINFKKRNH